MQKIGLKKKCILGIDPGTAITGWCAMEVAEDDRRVLAYGVVRTAAGMPMPLRLLNLHKEIDEIIKEFRPQSASIEGLYFFKNAKTVITVGQARGVTMLTCSMNGLSIFEYTPLQIKQTITGYGRADKKQVQEMVRVVLGLKEVPKPDDAADAVAAAYTHSVFNQIECIK